MGKSSSPSVTQASTLTGGQSALLNQLTGLLSGQIGQGVAPYSGELTPNANANQNSAFNYASQLLGGTAPGQSQTTSALQSLQQAYNPNSAQSQSYIQNGIVNPAMQSWNQQILPSLQNSFAGYDAMNGGQAQQAMGQAAGNFQSGLASTIANYQNNQQSLSDSNILNSSNALNNMSLNNLSAAAGLGNTQYGISQNQDTSAYQNWLSSQGYNNPYLNLLGSGLGTKAFENVVQPGTNYGGMAGSLLGGVGGLMGGLGSLGLF